MKIACLHEARKTRFNFVKGGVLRARLDSNGCRLIKFTDDRWVCTMMTSLPTIGLPKEPKGPPIPLFRSGICKTVTFLGSRAYRYITSIPAANPLKDASRDRHEQKTYLLRRITYPGCCPVALTKAVAAARPTRQDTKARVSVTHGRHAYNCPLCAGQNSLFALVAQHLGRDANVKRGLGSGVPKKT